MKIVLVSSEISPFAKTGGLADVAGDLPKFLRELNEELFLFTPLYKCTRASGIPLIDTGVRVDIPIGSFSAKGAIYQGELPGTDIPCFFIEQDAYYDRDQLYHTSWGDYPDNPQRFIFFCRAVVEAIEKLGLDPDIIHTHDWQAGLIPVYIKSLYSNSFANCRSLHTVHNLAYQGMFDKLVMKYTGLPWELFNYRQLEFYGCVNFLKGALVFADAINTVSKQYSREIKTQEFGYRLEGILTERSENLYGIMNGIDYSAWNPAEDNLLPAKYSPDDLSGKNICKKELRQEIGMEVDPRAPLAGIIARLTDQKGFDILASALHRMIKMGFQLVLLGSGEERYERTFRQLGKSYPGRFQALITFDNRLAHQIEAGADVFL
ncbi:MAG: glycogen/starch synthase, partial [Desulfatiglandales bacterium]|nr:glycogen/starch synthase [Desulfatiglandales bacterium]